MKISRQKNNKFNRKRTLKLQIIGLYGALIVLAIWTLLAWQR